MVYEYDILVEAGQADDDPEILNIPITRGVIHKYEVSFPPGCVNMVKVRIWHGLHQVWPTNPEGYHKGDGYLLSYREHYDLTEKPAILQVRVSSPGTVENHTVTVRFAILGKKILTPWLLTWAEKLGLYGGGE